MQYYSDITKKLYPTKDELYKEEKKVEKAAAEKAEREAKLKAERAVRANEVEQAFKDYQAAGEKYSKLRNDFIKDYGSYHMTYSNCNNSLNDLVETVLKIW